MTEDEIVGWQLNGHEFEQALGVGDGQGSLVCWSPWGCKESDKTEWLNWTEPKWLEYQFEIMQCSDFTLFSAFSSLHSLSILVLKNLEHIKYRVKKSFMSYSFLTF